MDDFGKSGGVARDQDGAVAIEGIFLGAHQGQGRGDTVLFQAGESGAKGLCLGDAVVVYLAADVAIALVAAGAELPAEENIADVGDFESALEGVAVKPGRMLAVGLRADVSDLVDAMLLQEFEETRELVGGMADGVERFHAGGFSQIVAAIL